MSSRYTAVVKIIKVEVTPAAHSQGTAQEKDTEVASIVVRSAELATLIKRTKAHLDLTEDV